MDEQNLQKRLESLEQKVDLVYRSSERMRTYFLWTLIITIAMVVLPLIALMFVIPSFLSTYSAISGF